MIVRMNKYTMVVLEGGREDFLKRLQELGMVDVTITDWEPTQHERTLMGEIEARRQAAEYLEKLSPTKPYATGMEAFDKYTEARREAAILDTEIARQEKLAAEALPWGEFDPERLHQLVRHGVTAEFLIEQAGIEVTGQAQGGMQGGTDEIKLPELNHARIEARISSLKAEREGWQEVLARAAATLPAIEADAEAMKDRLQFHRASKSGDKAADGTLAVMEAWAREKQASEVDAMLDADPGVLYIKERPTPDDATPVELHNNRVVRPFEFIAEMYAMPRYGTMDLTRWFAPFYMLFFAFCLADAGYGLLLFAGGVFLALKGRGAMKAIGKLSMWCGGAAVLFGFMAGSLFGVNIKEWFPGAKIFFPDDDMFLFGAAIGLGVLQILFGMVLRVVTTTRYFGIKYALSTIGWIVTLLAGGALLAQKMAGMLSFIPPVALIAAACVGVFMMLFLNNPGKNPLVNLGGGLWNLYNDVTGFLSDALSYIRLFAIGLSGGALATVFNDLAFGMSPDIPVVGQLVTLIILLIGHGLNLFMSTLSSMVHPLRLTFVEFYKNAGFEASQRVFDPLKNSTARTDE